MIVKAEYPRRTKKTNITTPTNKRGTRGRHGGKALYDVTIRAQRTLQVCGTKRKRWLMESPRLLNTTPESRDGTSRQISFWYGDHRARVRRRGVLYEAGRDLFVQNRVSLLGHIVKGIHAIGATHPGSNRESTHR